MGELSSIIGSWRGEFTDRKPSKWEAVRLIRDFANARADEAGILRYTKQYGPLDQNRPTGGERFHISVGLWQKYQGHFRAEWIRLGRRASNRKSVPFAMGTEKDEVIGFDGGNVRFQTNNLWRLLLMVLYSIPPVRLRVCARPDCPTPYFVAEHLSRTYCSTDCADWAQSQWRKEWWADHGKEWRDQRAKKAARKGRK